MKIHQLLLAAFTLILLICSCNSSSASLEERAKDSIKAALQKHMNDAKSYEAVEFSPLDTVYTTFYDDSANYEILEREMSLRIDTFTNENIRLTYTKQADSLKAIINQQASTYQGKPNGYMMYHSFRGKNGFGATILNTKMFRFDSTLRITEIEDVKK